MSECEHEYGTGKSVCDMFCQKCGIKKCEVMQWPGLRGEISRLRAELEWYADGKFGWDGGERARKALKGKE
jgi:hypothetical protein